MAPEKMSKEQNTTKRTSLHHSRINEKKLHTQPTNLVSLQKTAGNQAVQRLVLQKLGSDSGKLDEETIHRINKERGQGQGLDSSVQNQMSQAMGMDFSHVDIHNSQESNHLNQQLNAKAFTTGKDIFFREGEYQPHTSSGQNLIAHELTHVVQQSTGQVPTGDSMHVNPPDDVFEKQADSLAQNITTRSDVTGIQKQTEEEEEPVQTQEMPEEEEIQTMSLQKQEESEEEEQY